MTQDQQRRAAALWVTSRGDLTRKQCDELAKDMDMKQVFIDRLLSGLANVLLATAIGLIGAVLLGNWSVCEQDDRHCMFTGEEK